MFNPFAKTQAECEKIGDPRLSLEERYLTPAEYLLCLAVAAKKLQEGEFLLDEDVASIIERNSTAERK